jgi:hypothetical protein
LYRSNLGEAYIERSVAVFESGLESREYGSLLSVWGRENDGAIFPRRRMDDSLTDLEACIDLLRENEKAIVHQSAILDDIAVSFMEKNLDISLLCATFLT